MEDQEFSLNLFEAVSKDRVREVRERLEAGDWDVKVRVYLTARRRLIYVCISVEN